MPTSWRETAAASKSHAAAQASRNAKIPKEWLLPTAIKALTPTNILPIFKECGILTSKELAITDVEDATTLLAKMREKEWTALEVTIAYCKRAAIAQQLVNCLIDMDFDAAIAHAKELDNHLWATGETVGPLHGLPVSTKDLTYVKGMRVTMGYICEADFVAATDAIVVQTLRKAGAVLYVKTTMPMTGMALETVSNLWGRTLNPMNTALTPGGSSGGESALNCCHGSPIGIATDIGGSIRAPAAFTGLYGIRPTSRRFSYLGNANFTGQASILSTLGPVGRSLRDLCTMLKVWSDNEPWLYDPVVMAKQWNPVPVPEKATIGFMFWDEVVMPHPPVQRAMKLALEKVKAAGHEVVEVKPLRHKHAWDIARRLYFQTGGKEMKDQLARTGEPPALCASSFLDGAEEMSIFDLAQYNRDQRQYQVEYLTHWNGTASLTSTGKPVDAILCPPFASAAYPHDVFPWWGYLSIWNLLDYPAVVIPVGQVEANDVKDASYKPVNELDQQNYDMYALDLFIGAPTAVQLVGRTFMEEELLALAIAVDVAIKH